jgi:glycosyltransferase involved in cell wall biosynthesis
MDFPKVTIAIPTFNRADYLVQAATSALAQTYGNIEVIVSDNASDDDTLVKLAQFHDDRLVVLKHTVNLGMEKNWNACLKAATGEFFILLSDDDFLEPRAIEELMKPFLAEGSHDVGMVYTKIRILDVASGGVSFGPSSPESEDGSDMVSAFLYNARAIYPCSTLMRTRDIVELGGYDGGRYFCALDAAMWMQIVLKRGRVVFIDEALSSYRRHAENQTMTSKIDEWVAGLTNLVDTCAEIYRVQFDAVKYSRFVKAGNRYIAFFAHHLLKRGILAGSSKVEGFRSYRRYYPYFKRAGMVGFWTKTVLKIPFK